MQVIQKECFSLGQLGFAKEIVRCHELRLISEKLEKRTY
jgi:hypothetical protein